MTRDYKKNINTEAHIHRKIDTHAHTHDTHLNASPKQTTVRLPQCRGTHLTFGVTNLFANSETSRDTYELLPIFCFIINF